MISLSTPCDGFKKIEEMARRELGDKRVFQLHVMDSGGALQAWSSLTKAELSTPCDGF
jgi:hypothetical protein